MGNRRATAPLEKKARRQQMLIAAERLFESWSYTDITMDRIADQTGVAKGTLYLYFHSKEELFLQLYEERLLEWYSELEALACLGSHTVAPAAAARVIATTLGAHPSLVRLHGVVHSTACTNIDLETTLVFRNRQRTGMESLGAALARRINGLSEEHAIRFLVRLEALVGGLSWSAFPSSTLVRAFEKQGIDVFHIDFEEELREIITALLS